jgi:hypothetical protein
MKIAFLFFIYDTINNYTLWEYFFNNIDKSKYNIYIHYKNNVFISDFLNNLNYLIINV